MDRILEALANAVEWQQGGWPDWSLYRPIAASVVKAGGPVIAADLAPAMKDAVARNGIAALPQRWRDRLGLDEPLPPGMHEAMAEEIKTVHCDMAPPEMIAAMVRVQRARDAALAMAMLDALDRPDAGQAILITGNGHARRDRGVLWLLRHALEDAEEVKSLSIGLIEVQPGLTAPQDYAAGTENPLPYDVVVFTGSTAQGDPCERFRKQLEGMKGNTGKAEE